jgi:hypothetical protein
VERENMVMDEELGWKSQDVGRMRRVGGGSGSGRGFK